MASTKPQVILQGKVYTLLNRKTSFEPYVVAFQYDFHSGTWTNGHYFSNLKSAMKYLYEVEE